MMTVLLSCRNKGSGGVLPSSNLRVGKRRAAGRQRAPLKIISSMGHGVLRNVFKNARRTPRPQTSARRDCRRTGGTLCRAVLLWICMFAEMLYMNACLPSAFAFNTSEFSTAKTACLLEAATGICPNVETTHGQIGSWDVSSVTSLSDSKS